MNNEENIALYAFRTFGDTVLRAAYACCGSFAEAEDITQDVFLLLHSKPMYFSDDGHLKAWLLRVTVNKCKNLKRSFRVSRTGSIETEDITAATYEMVIEDESLLRQIEALPEKYASVCQRCFTAGMTASDHYDIGSLIHVHIFFFLI